MDDKVIIGGKEYPVKVNFNSVAAFLKAKGTDSLEAFADFGKIPLSDYPLLVACCVNEGAGSEVITAQEVGSTPDSFREVPDAVTVIFRAMIPGNSREEEGDKKKD